MTAAISTVLSAQYRSRKKAFRATDKRGWGIEDNSKKIFLISQRKHVVTFH